MCPTMVKQMYSTMYNVHTYSVHLLGKFRRISMYVAFDAIAKLYVT